MEYIEAYNAIKHFEKISNLVLLICFAVFSIIGGGARLWYEIKSRKARMQESNEKHEILVEKIDNIEKKVARGEFYHATYKHKRNIAWVTDAYAKCKALGINSYVDKDFLTWSAWVEKDKEKNPHLWRENSI